MNPSCGEIREDPDELFSPQVGKWAQDKCSLLANYAEVFATATKIKWQERVYVDLFSGAGKSKLRDMGKIIPGSPLLALSVKDAFNRYVFCERSPKCMSALRTRVNRKSLSVPVHFIQGDVNKHIDELLSVIPRGSYEHRVLSFCFVDPFGLSGLGFEVIRSLSKRYVDFLVHLPADGCAAQLGAVRGEERHYRPFLGDDEWRADWQSQRHQLDFDSFIARQFDKRMKKLDFTFSGSEESVFIRSSAKNLPLYRLGFYSRSELGKKLWNAVRSCLDDQLSLGL